MKSEFARIRTHRPVLVTIVLMLMGVACATSQRTVPPALDPANPDAEERPASTALTPLVPPGPLASSSSGADDAATTGGAHAGHDMAGMKKTDPNDKAKPEGGHAGHDMAAMKKTDPNDKAKPESGHDMAGMKKTDPNDKAKSESGHDMAGMKKTDPNDKAKPESGHDMAGMKRTEPTDKAKPESGHAGHDMAGMKTDKGAPDGEEHLMGVVTQIADTSLTVILEKGSSVVVLTDKETEFERGEAKASLKGIKSGERIVIYATPKDGKWLARVVKLSAPTPKAKPTDAGTSSTPHDHGTNMPDTKNPQQAQEFTCPMHPEIRSPTQGKCPKCGMKLQPVAGK